MAIRNFWQEPPYRNELVQRDGKVTSSWHLFFDFVAKILGRRVVVDVTADPPNLVAGAVVSATVTVPGAATGDFAVASFDPMNVGISLTAQVTSANTVTVWFQNNTAGAIDLASGTLRVWLEKNS